MLRTQPIRSRYVITSLATIAIITAYASRCSAGMISYGNFGPVPPGISFLNVTESSGTDPVPLFGPPTPFSIGLDFTPTSFVSTSNNGNLDVTDGQLNFTVAGSNAFPVNGVGLAESGDYTLFGAGTALTQAVAGAIIRAMVTEINGLPVAPFGVPTANASVSFNLAANPGIVQPWSLATFLPINLPQGQRATKVDISIDNQLLTASESGTLSFIAKKDFRIDVGTNPPVPEPGPMLVALIGSTIFGAWTRRNRR